MYWPGLSGPFLFDDYANLAALGEYGGVRDWETFKLYVFGNNSGPTGRPLAMLSFLANDTNWPSDPWAFKFTNLILHLLNTALLYQLVCQVTRITRPTDDRRTQYVFAAITAGLWLLHPLHISTVLYPVQRMAILSALFTLGGLLFYVHGRMLLATASIKGHMVMSLAITLGTLLATFSKENGALLPLLAICIEYTVFAKQDTEPDYRWKIIFLWLPVLILISYFMYGFATGIFQNLYDQRPFTLEQRLLTQPRVILDYLYYWYIPHISSTGILSQNFPISISLLNPVTTAPAIVVIFSLLASAIIMRKRYPLYALAVLFYFSGHIIESTIVPLELYYEHRNYLPSIFLFLPFVIMTYRLLPQQNTYVRSIIWPAVLLLLAFLTSVRAEIWSDEESLAYHWAENNPTSQRAQRNAALVASNNNKHRLALDIMENARNNLPNNIAINLHWLTLTCQIREVRQQEINSTIGLMRTGYFSFKNFALLESVLRQIISPECKGLDISDAKNIITALWDNPLAKKREGPAHQLHFLHGILALEEAKPQIAMGHFQRSLLSRQNIDAGIIQTGMLASAGYYTLALEHLQFIESTINIKSHSGSGRLDYDSEIQVLREMIKADMEPGSH